MHFSQLFAILAAAFIGVAVAGPLDTRGGRPCGFSNPDGYEACPPEWPVCVKFPSSCQSDCAGICTKGK